MKTDTLSQHETQDSMKRTKQVDQLKLDGGNGMNKRRARFWIIGAAVLVIAGLLAGVLGVLGFLPWQSGNLYEDPQGRFSVKLEPSWERVETDGSSMQFRLPDPAFHMYVLVLKASTIEDAFSQGLQTLGFDPGLLTGGGVTSFGDWQAYSQKDAAGYNYGLAGQIVGENAFVMVVKADKPGVDVENAAVLRALTSIKITGKQEVSINNYTDLEGLVRQGVDRLAGSVSVAVVQKGKIVYTYTYGKANPLKGIAADAQTIYAFGSMTKPFTAVALMQQVEQGKVNLDAWPGEYVPEFPKRWNVTVRQLLDHSACMPDNERLAHGLIVRRGETFAPLAEIFTSYVKDYTELLCAPGSSSQYSNPHYLALARIVEVVSGEPYESYVVDHILTPLAMDATRFELVEADERYAKPQLPATQTDALVAQLNEFRGPGQETMVLGKSGAFSTLDDVRILPPWGGLHGTPSDVTHFLQMFLDNGRYGDVQILKPESVAAMEKMQTSTDGSPLGLGLSWWIGKDDAGTFYYHHGGAPGVENTMRFYPDLDLGVVVMANVAGYQSDKIIDGLVSAWMHQK